MDTPIINPIYIYLAGVCPTLQTVLLVLGIMGLITTLIFSACALSEYDYDELRESEGAIRATKTSKKYLIITSAIIILGVLIPSEKTIYGMIAAKYVTPANIESVGNSAKEVVDYIFEKVEEMDNDNG